MKEYTVYIKFIDGGEAEVDVEAENENQAMDKAMPMSLEAIEKE